MKEPGLRSPCAQPMWMYLWSARMNEKSSPPPPGPGWYGEATLLTRAGARKTAPLRPWSSPTGRPDVVGASRPRSVGKARTIRRYRHHVLRLGRDWIETG